MATKRQAVSHARSMDELLITKSRYRWMAGFLLDWSIPVLISSRLKKQRLYLFVPDSSSKSEPRILIEFKFARPVNRELTEWMNERTRVSPSIKGRKSPVFFKCHWTMTAHRTWLDTQKRRRRRSNKGGKSISSEWIQIGNTKKAARKCNYGTFE